MVVSDAIRQRLAEARGPIDLLAEDGTLLGSFLPNPKLVKRHPRHLDSLNGRTGSQRREAAEILAELEKKR
jgi:hypothetical protein